MAFGPIVRDFSAGRHQHWHIDVSYLNVGGTFYYLCSVLDGFSRYIVNWDIRESMTEADIEIILQGAKEKYPEARPRIISDNGPQFIAKDFKEFIRISGMTHVRTSPFYPQSNGKIERWHKSLKGECIRPGTPLSLDDARRLVSGYVDHYNNVRLNSATGYITPKDMLPGRQQEIHAERDRKLEAARKQRQIAASKPLDLQIALCSAWGVRSLKLPGLTTNETRQVNTALLIAGTDLVASGYCTGILTGAPEIQAALT
jgi:transposase InsO family protein